MTPWYASRTIWFNAIAGLALLLQTRYGFVLDPELQACLLTMINAGLRLITKTPLDWKSQPTPTDNAAGSIRLPLLITIGIMAALLMLSGCAGTTSARLNAGLDVADDVTDIALALCKDGTLPAEPCAAIVAGNLAIDLIEQIIDPHVEWVE